MQHPTLIPYVSPSLSALQAFLFNILLLIASPFQPVHRETRKIQIAERTTAAAPGAPILWLRAEGMCLLTHLIEVLVNRLFTIVDAARNCILLHREVLGARLLVLLSASAREQFLCLRRMLIRSIESEAAKPCNLRRWDAGGRDELGDYECLVCGQRWTQVERSLGRYHVQTSHGMDYVKVERVNQKGSLSEAEKRERAKAAVRKYKQVGAGAFSGRSAGASCPHTTLKLNTDRCPSMRLCLAHRLAELEAVRV